MTEIKISQEKQGERLDIFLQHYLREHFNGDKKLFTRSQVQNRFVGYATVNGTIQKRGYKLSAGDLLLIDHDLVRDEVMTIKKETAHRFEVVPFKGNLNIVYEDDDLLFIDKPSGISSTPSKANMEDNIAARALYYLSSAPSHDQRLVRGGVVHRLDKDVSGLMVVAKNLATQNELLGLFKKRKVVKLYRATVQPLSPEVRTALNFSSGQKLELARLQQQLRTAKQLDQVIKTLEGIGGWVEMRGVVGRDKSNRWRMEFTLGGKGKSSVTRFLPLAENELLVWIQSGRMHQIRATLRYMGYAVSNDQLYMTSKWSKLDPSRVRAIGLRSWLLAFNLNRKLYLVSV